MIHPIPIFGAVSAVRQEVLRCRLCTSLTSLNQSLHRATISINTTPSTARAPLTDLEEVVQQRLAVFVAVAEQTLQQPQRSKLQNCHSRHVIAGAVQRQQ